jgi:hypothetical protein
VVIIFDVRVALVQGCRQIAVKKGCPISKIDIADLLEFQEKTRILYEHEKKTATICRIKKLLRFRVRSEQLLEVLDRAVSLVQDDQEDHDNWFHCMDCKLAFFCLFFCVSVPCLRSLLFSANACIGLTLRS